MPPGAFRGAFQEMTLVLPCSAVYATYEQVSLSHGYRGGSQGTPPGTPVLAKYPNKACLN